MVFHGPEVIGLEDQARVNSSDENCSHDGKENRNSQWSPRFKTSRIAIDGTERHEEGWKEWNVGTDLQ